MGARLQYRSGAGQFLGHRHWECHLLGQCQTGVVTQLAKLIDKTRPSLRILEDHLLKTTESEVIAQKMEAFVSDALVPISEALFYKTRVGLVVGFRSASGLDVVLKIVKWV
jgi:hypothetical protein